MHLQIALESPVESVREHQEQRKDVQGVSMATTELFTAAIRKFMEMETLTAPLLWELIDHIDVYEAEGTGKNRTQRICICYRFVGYLEVPVPDDVLLALDMRRGVRVNYTSKAV